MSDHGADAAQGPQPSVLGESITRPAGLADGPGHVVVHGNPAFRAMFGETAVGLPARESMLDLPAEAFTLLDAVLRTGRPLARWIERAGETWRLTAMPRVDPGTTKVYGVAFHLRSRSEPPGSIRPTSRRPGSPR